MRDMCSTVHNLPLEPWERHAVQDYRGLSNLCQDKERVSDVPARLGVWPPYPSTRHGLGPSERGTHQRHQQRVLCPKYGGQSALHIII